MAEQGPAISRKVWLHTLDLTGAVNAVTLELSVEPQDNTVFGDQHRSEVGGLYVTRSTVEGLSDFAQNAQDEVHHGSLAVADRPFTVAADDAAVGSVAYLFQSMQSRYGLLGPIGEMARYSAEAGANSRAIRGVMLHDGTETGATNGTAVQIGSVAAGERIYGALHVSAYSGFTDVTVTLESDDASGFPSPTSQLTFATVTGRTSEFASVAGDINDDWWRMALAVTGSGSVTLAVAAGIL